MQDLNLSMQVEQKTTMGSTRQGGASLNDITNKENRKNSANGSKIVNGGLSNRIDFKEN